jgi:hypothetical protein
LAPRLVSASSWNPQDEAKAAAKNSLADHALLLEEFQKFNAGALQYMTQAYGSDVACSISGQAGKEFEALLPLIPDLGGARNIVIGDFPVAMWCVGYFRPMKAHGKTAEQLGKMIYDLFEAKLRLLPETASLSEGAKQFTPEHIVKLKEWAQWTQKRDYPASWVAVFAQGDGVDFDYGYDYSECAIVKYLKAHGADEVAPYICLNDFIKSRTYGTGLSRTKTLALGYDVCNFRYRKGRPVNQDWSTEISIIKQSAKARSL